MSTLNWLGKDAVLNHHLDVPYRTLELKESFNCESGKSENKIIHGDNLEALKALLPEYEGLVKCIYIDPPYNTGEENWVYNDNVNSPRIRKWLGQVVGKESEDLTRHDKWLCMMYPRLKLLQKLLSEDGAIFISIDDNEQANLKLICDEIFGAGNFVANMIWQSRTSISNDYEISMNHNHSLIYAKNRIDLTFAGDEIDIDDYENPDNDPRGPYKLVPIDANHIGGDTLYPIRNPYNGIDYYPPNGRIWCYNQATMQKLIDDDRIKFGKNNCSAPKKKLFYNERIAKGDRKTPSSVILDAGTTKDGTNMLMEIFGKRFLIILNRLN